MEAAPFSLQLADPDEVEAARLVHDAMVVRW
jgi:hypothetical protein